VTNANAAVGATPTVWTGDVNSNDHAMYLKNLRDSGYNPRNDYSPNGLLKVE